MEIGEGGVTQKQLKALADMGFNGGGGQKNAVKEPSSLGFGKD